MHRFKALASGGLLAASLLALGAPSIAADRGTRPNHHRLERLREIREDRSKLREDLQKLRADRKSGASNDLIAQDKDQVKADLKELRDDRKALGELRAGENAGH